MNATTYFANKGRLFWAMAGSVLLAAVTIIDILSGYELAFSLFYLLPVSLLAWFGGRRTGIAAAVASAVCWFGAEVVSGRPYSHPSLPYWNSAIRFGVFLTVALLIFALRKAHEHEKEIARVDNLTGAVNTRFFYELMQMEIERSKRNKQPFTVVYFDLDNFKYVNDRYGHGMGDKVLCATVRQAKSQLRKVDVVARLGGDEFALLLPETDHAEAQVAISKVQISLLDEMRRNDWPVTFSIGVLTCLDFGTSTDEIIRQADGLMYTVKNTGKNSISFSVLTGQS